MKIRIVRYDPAKTATPLLVLIHDESAVFYDAKKARFAREAARLEERGKSDRAESEALITRGNNEQVENLLFYTTKAFKYWTRAEKVKTIAAKALQFARKFGIGSVSFALNGRDGREAAAWVAEGCLIGGYKFRKYKNDKDKKEKKVALQLLVRAEDEAEVKKSLRRIELICGSVNFCRDLINEPSAVIYPQSLAETAQTMCAEAGLQCEVLDEKQLLESGYTGIYSVGKGSARKPRLIIMRYNPGGESHVHLALVGKAVTFDTGGYSIKPAKDMWEMKGDMSGGAAVIAAMRTIAKLKPSIRVTGIVPSAQNMIDADALLPGDIITTKIGKTVHIDNTDAEGRLILMDALIRAKEEKVTHVVDAATLTGSVVRALGTSMSGIFGTDDELVNRISEAGIRVGEDFWRLPLTPEYREMLNSEIADIDNSGRSPNAGAIVAGLFLKEFVDPSISWAHLDIAGTFLTSKNWKYYCPGATGVAVRTFVELVESFMPVPRTK